MSCHYRFAKVGGGGRWWLYIPRDTRRAFLFQGGWIAFSVFALGGIPQKIFIRHGMANDVPPLPPILPNYFWMSRYTFAPLSPRSEVAGSIQQMA